MVVTVASASGEVAEAAAALLMLAVAGVVVALAATGVWICWEHLVLAVTGRQAGWVRWAAPLAVVAAAVLVVVWAKPAVAIGLRLQLQLLGGASLMVFLAGVARKVEGLSPKVWLYAVIVIVGGILAWIAADYHWIVGHAMNSARNRSEYRIHEVSNAVHTFRSAHNQYPDSLGEVVAAGYLADPGCLNPEPGVRAVYVRPLPKSQPNDLMLYYWPCAKDGTAVARVDGAVGWARRDKMGALRMEGSERSFVLPETTGTKEQ